MIVVFGLLTSCLQIDQTVTIQSTGSGSQVVKMVIPGRVIEALQQQAVAHNQLRKAPDMTTIFHRAKVEKELAAVGLELTEHKVVSASHQREALLAVRFQNLEQLRRSPLGGGGADWIFTKGPLKDTIQLEYYPRGRAAWLESRQKVLELQKHPKDPILQGFFSRQAAQLQGLDITVTINLPGTVLKAYGDLRETGLRQVQARVRAKDIKTPKDLILALAPRYRVVFDGRGCNLLLASTPATGQAPAPEQASSKKRN